MYAYQLIRRQILRTDFKCSYLIVDISRMLLKLPIGFFDSKNLGDIIQRIDDHRRVQQFLSNSTLDVLFSAVNIIIFGAVLLHYNLRLFLVFLCGDDPSSGHRQECRSDRRAPEGPAHRKRGP